MGVRDCCVKMRKRVLLEGAGEDCFMILCERFGFAFSCRGVYPSDDQLHSTAPQ